LSESALHPASISLSSNTIAYQTSTVRAAFNIILFILLYVGPIAVGVYSIEPRPSWLQRLSGTAPVLEPFELADEAPAPPPPEKSTSIPDEPAEQSVPEPGSGVDLKEPTVVVDEPEPEPVPEPPTEEPVPEPPTEVPEQPIESIEGAAVPSRQPKPALEPERQPTQLPQIALIPEIGPKSRPKRLKGPMRRPLQENERFFVYGIRDRMQFDRLARRDNVPGALGVREIKVLLDDVESNSPIIYYINTGQFPYHYCFVRDLLSPGLPHSTFKNAAYYKDVGRKYLAFSLVAHDSFQNAAGSNGAYVITFWPTDPVKFNYVSLAYDLVVETMQFDAKKVYYQPAGIMQEELYRNEKKEFEEAGVKVLLTQDLYSNFSFSPLNTGVSFGRLLMSGPSTTYSSRDIVVFKTLPNDLSVAAGIITEAPQTPLSHVNLKAQQNGIPNAFISDATTNEKLTELAGEYVRYEVSSDGWRVTKAAQDEVDAFLEASRPAALRPPPSNLAVTSIMPLRSLGHRDLSAFGAKAANLAELKKILPAEMVPDGEAVPFFFYNEFMKHNGFYEVAQSMIKDESFQTDAAIRRERLKAFRNRIKEADAPEWMMQKLEAMQQKFPEGQHLRCRSSTNNEDLEGFNGAGLYNSRTHKEDEGHIIKSMRQVWSGLWTYRAYEERDFYGIDHMKVFMGVLVHPNYKGEVANGVGITRNIFDPRWLGFYVNVQVGEDLITNPDEESIPEEFLVSVMTGGPRDQAYSLEIQYARRSNKIPKGETVLTRQQSIELARNMRIVHRHFRSLYGKQDDDTFAMDLEFKIDSDGKLVIKQARPWVWPNLPSAEDTDC
jgi:pyruvate,water dikinase